MCQHAGIVGLADTGRCNSRYGGKCRIFAIECLEYPCRPNHQAQEESGNADLVMPTALSPHLPCHVDGLRGWRLNCLSGPSCSTLTEIGYAC